MEYADFVEKCVKEYKETENEFVYQLIDPFCETVVEKKLSKAELKLILLKGMQESIPLDKVKQAINKVSNLRLESGIKGNIIDDEIYIDSMAVLNILDELIESEGE